MTVLALKASAAEKEAEHLKHPKQQATFHGCHCHGLHQFNCFYYYHNYIANFNTQRTLDWGPKTGVQPMTPDYRNFYPCDLGQGSLF